jgi:ribonucleoside-diphosphate reductase alpha chain
MTEGLRIERRFTTEGQDPYDSIEWARRDSRITNPDGSAVFEMTDAEIPAGWSQVATDIMVSKYFRKAGVPQVDEAGEPLADGDGNRATGPERSAKQVFDRLAGTWRWWGENHGYFATPSDAQAFEDELKYMLATQMAAPNSPQWFNTGLHHAYGLTGPAQGFWYVDPETEELVASPDSYSRPAPHACFPAGTRIWVRDGFKPIEKVEPGDEVLTHTGTYRPVREVMQRQVEEDLVRIRLRKLAAAELLATSNHPVLAVRADAAARARRGDRSVRPEWIDAGDLRPGDYVLVADPQSADVVPDPVDLAGFAGPNFEVRSDTIVTRNSGHRPSMTRHVRFDDPAVMRLLGRWLGDGSIGHEALDGEVASVNFVFDAEDRAGIADVSELMLRFFGVTAQVELAQGQRTAHLRFTRRPLARWFVETFGEGFAGKTLPGWVYELPAEHRRQLLLGLHRSDGCVLDQGSSKSLCFDQSNAELAHGIWRLARSLGYSPSLIGGTVRPGGTEPPYRVQISVKDAPELAERCGVEIPAAPAERRELHLDAGVAYRVVEVGAEPYFGTVYNFQVDADESYVANGAVVHNCFILGVRDDLVNPGGIMDLWTREARIFKFGSGAGSNFSAIRAENERLSGGGKSSGVMSFLKIGDRAAGAIKSGGTTRRAAKMVILDVDHPDIETFVDWKKVEEDKARLLIQYGGFPADFNGEAYATVSGQNSNNSVRVTNDFVRAVLEDGDWELRNRTDGSIRKTIKARDLWSRIAEAAWACADPGLQFDTTINEWHTCPAGGRIKASNPCSEYMFLDDTACNLASLNLVTFETSDGGFDVDGYRHAIRLWTIVLEISVTMAHFPSMEIAQGSYDYRTLGLGYANLGSLLMRQGIAYDSDEGRAIAGALTAILTGYSYATSAEMAAVVGPFPRFAENREHMLRVIRNHRRAAYDTPLSEYEGITSQVMGIDPAHAPADLLAAARQSWDLALTLGEEHGYRNAQATVLAPTGTIGLLMDCDTTGVEPDFALVKFKKLAGGGYFKIANQSVAPALRHLGYAEDEITGIVRYIVGTSSLERAPHVNRESLAEKGFTEEEIDKIQAVLPGVFELRHAFNVFVVGEAALQRLGFGVDEYTSWDFDLLGALGFSRDQVRQANDIICGRQTIEGAPHLRDEHLPVFDTANKNGRYGERFIHHDGHIKMMAAAQPFISGAISKTINMPTEVTAADIEDAYRLSWELGLKAMALYRDGSKASQPLSATTDEGDDEGEETAELSAAVDAEKRIAWGEIPAGMSPTQAYAQGMHPPRFLLPSRRGGWTQEARIGGHKVYLRTGEYGDGTLGEVFIDLAKEGATLRGVLASFAIAVSKGLQYGVPLEEFVDTFTFQTFEPRGLVEGHPNIKMANSIIDYVFRALAIEYLHRDELAQVPPNRDGDLPGPPKGLAVEAGVQLDLTDAVAEQAVEAVKAAVEFTSAPVTVSDGPGAQAKQSERVPARAAVAATDAGTASMQSVLGEMMGDAPLCDVCGHITVRNGSCYKCLNCGNSLGCS